MMPKRKTIGTSPLDAVIPITPSENRSESESGSSFRNKTLEAKPDPVEVSEDTNDAIGVNTTNGSIAVVDDKAPVSRAQRKERLTVHLPRELVERCRNAVYWTPGLTLASLAEEALSNSLDAMEQARGEPFAARTGELKAGRPVR